MSAVLIYFNPLSIVQSCVASGGLLKAGVPVLSELGVNSHWKQLPTLLETSPLKTVELSLSRVTGTPAYTNRPSSIEYSQITGLHCFAPTRSMYYASLANKIMLFHSSPLTRLSLESGLSEHRLPNPK